jgi:hypothetical protein
MEYPTHEYDKHRLLILETKLYVRDRVIQLRRTRDDKLLGEMALGFAHAHDERFGASDIHSAISHKLVAPMCLFATITKRRQNTNSTLQGSTTARATLWCGIWTTPSIRSITCKN